MSVYLLVLRVELPDNHVQEVPQIAYQGLNVCSLVWIDKRIDLVKRNHKFPWNAVSMYNHDNIQLIWLKGCPHRASAVAAPAASDWIPLKYMDTLWRSSWRLEMGLGPILERHNVLQWIFAADAAARCV